MKKITASFLFCLLLVTTVISSAVAQISPIQSNPLGLKDPWTKADLIEPAVLAAAIQAKKAPVIFNIGSVQDIKGAVHIGAGNKQENIEKLKKAATALPKNARIVVYCGCCPFARCPNIRPAFSTLKAAGIKHIQLLNLADNLNTNWTSKGYPLQAE